MLVHLFKELCQQELARFWDEAKRLALIRHENVVLFMGVSFDGPNAALVSRQEFFILERFAFCGKIYLLKIPIF